MTRIASLFALVLLALGAAGARADVDLTITNGDTVLGTLSPGTQQATFRFRAPTLAVLNVVATGKKAKGATQTPAVRFRIIDSLGFEVASSQHLTTPKGDKLKNVGLGLTGEYRAVVTSSNGVAGDYQLQIKWKTLTPLSYDTGNITAGLTNFGFAADAGAVPTFDLKLPKGSPVRPWLQKFTDFGTYNQTFPQPPAGTTNLKIKGAALPRTADYGAFTTDVGGAGGGPYKLTITLKLPKPSKRKISLTSSLLGSSLNGESTARGAIVDPTGGLVGLSLTSGTPIDGASVLIPPGALTTATAIVVGMGRPIPGSGGRSATGPTVVFGPDGAKFKTAVTITIPFDPVQLEGGDPNALQVFTRDAKGRVTQVTTPLTVDLVRGTVSFTSSHFSSYRAFGPTRHSPADLDGDGVDDLVIPAPLDSQERGAVYVFRGRPDLAGGKVSDADFVFTGENAKVGQTDGDYFGAAVATGDVNGDGIADLVVGATRADGGKGRVYVFFGGTGFASLKASQADAVLTADAADQRFGGTLVVADVDGDQHPDVVVGAPLSSRFWFSGGAAYVFPGGTAFADVAAADPNVIALAAAGPFQQFGTSIAVGDLDADGKADIAVGAEQLVSQGTGQVYVFLDVSHKGPEQHAGDGTVDFNGGGTDDRFGVAVAIGDLNQDGVDDLAAGAPGADDPNDPAMFDIGYVYVFFGGVNLTGRPAGNADVLIDGYLPAASDGLGESLAIGNVLGSSAADVISTAPGSDAGSTTDGGAIHVTRGGPDFWTNRHVAFGETLDEQVGVVLPAADVNGDGFLDTVVASPRFNSGAGAVRVRLGPGLFGPRLDFTGSAGQSLGARDVTSTQAP